MGLNHAQTEAVTKSIDCQLQIIAGPGTGKTKTLTSRVVHLIHTLQINPQNIIVMTFTNQAAIEMKKRINDMLIGLGDEKLAESTMKKLCIGTFHSICYRYLVKYGKKSGQINIKGIADDREKKQIIRAVLTDEGFENFMKKQGFSAGESNVSGNSWFSKKFGVSCRMKYYDLMRWISEKKNEQKHRNSELLNTGISDEILNHFFESYQEILEKTGKLDFDDILLKCRDMLITHPHLVDFVETVLVDEFQDSSSVQLDLTCLFSQKKNSFTVVGDPDQSIYAFRGAVPENFKILFEKYPNCHRIFLEENYRSTEPILELSTALICQDPKRIGGTDRRLIAARHGAKEKYGMSSYLTLKNSYEEREFIESNIHYLIKMSKNALKYGDFAILCRTKAQVRFYSALRGLPVTLLGNKAFWEKPFISSIISYLHVINNIEDRINIEQTLNIPKKGLRDGFTTKFCLQDLSKSMTEKFETIDQQTDLSAKMINQIKKYYHSITRWRSRVLKNNNSETLVEIVTEIGETIMSPLRELSSESSKEMLTKNTFDLENLVEIIKQSSMAGDDPDFDLFDEIGPLDYFLSTVAMHGEHGKQKQNHNSITVATIHGSKGLEFPIVFLAGVDDFAKKKPEELDEERRILFVGVTRAQLMLNISYSKIVTVFGNSISANENGFLKHENCRDWLNCRNRQIDDIPPHKMKLLTKFLDRKPMKEIENEKAFKIVEKNGSKTAFSSFTSAAELLKTEKQFPMQQETKGKRKKEADKRDKIKKKTGKIQPVGQQKLHAFDMGTKALTDK